MREDTSILEGPQPPDIAARVDLEEDNIKRTVIVTETFPDPETDLARRARLPSLPAAIRTMRADPVSYAVQLAAYEGILYKTTLEMRLSKLEITLPPQSDLMEPAKNLPWRECYKNGKERYPGGKMTPTQLRQLTLRCPEYVKTIETHIGLPFKDIDVDHVVPKNQGGLDNILNYRWIPSRLSTQFIVLGFLNLLVRQINPSRTQAAGKVCA